MDETLKDKAERRKTLAEKIDELNKALKHEPELAGLPISRLLDFVDSSDKSYQIINTFRSIEYRKNTQELIVGETALKALKKDDISIVDILSKIADKLKKFSPLSAADVTYESETQYPDHYPKITTVAAQQTLFVRSLYRFNMMQFGSPRYRLIADAALVSLGVEMSEDEVNSRISKWEGRKDDLSNLQLRA